MTFFRILFGIFLEEVGETMKTFVKVGGFQVDV
jgi:hypothetical protein